MTLAGREVAGGWNRLHLGRWRGAAFASPLLALHRLAPQRYPHLLYSAASAGPHARYSLLLAFPGATLELGGDGVLRYDGERRAAKGDFITAFDSLWRRHRQPFMASGAPRPPFTGGWFVYLGYELAQQLEPKLALAPPPSPWPRALATRFPAALIYDHHHGLISAVVESGGEALLKPLLDDWRSLAPAPPAAEPPPCRRRDLEEDQPQPYLRAAAAAIEYIRAGDVFQVNLSRGWRGRLAGEVSHASLFARLAGCNPAPFAALLSWGERAIISSSPERLASVQGGVVQTRPIAGTRPRGASGVTDVALWRELLAHPKERAEHLMLVDLERNDLSRVCRPGSVKVTEMMVVESYAHVHHIVSNIRGVLKDEATPGAVMAAVFPGGTITGCPKVRCMEILAELEDVSRGAYTGSAGYVNHDGSMDLNILIRTLTRFRRRVDFRAGGGLVADSDPQRELLETRSKAHGLVRALTEQL